MEGSLTIASAYTAIAQTQCPPFTNLGLDGMAISDVFKDPLVACVEYQDLVASSSYLSSLLSLLKPYEFWKTRFSP